MRSERRQPELLGNQSHRGTEGLVLHPSYRVCVCMCVCRSTGLPEGGAVPSMGGVLLDLVRVFRVRGRARAHTQPALGRAVRMRADEDPSS